MLRRGYLADLVLTNYDMQPMDGIEFTRRLRRGEGGDAHRIVPVLMVSAFSEAERVTRARDSGIDSYLVKPLSPRVLLEHLLSVLQNPRTHIEEESMRGRTVGTGAEILPVDQTVGGRARAAVTRQIGRAAGRERGCK